MIILLTDDDESFVSIMETSLRDEGFEVDVARDGAEARKKATTNEYDLMLLDLNLPFIRGEELCRVLKNKIKCPIIVMSGICDSKTKEEVLASGAFRYVTKPVDIKTFILELNALINGLYPKARRNLLTLGNVVVDIDARSAEIRGQSIDLTPKEFTLLAHLLRNRGIAISKEELYREVWDMKSCDLKSNTLETHIFSLRKKLGVTAGKLIVTKNSYGYIIKL